MTAHRRRQTAALGAIGIAVAAGLEGCAAAPLEDTVGRVEVHPLTSLTLGAAQVLAGASDGPTAAIAGELRLPAGGPQRLPAVVMLHGDAGSFGNQPPWTDTLTALGIAVFTLDSFSGRGAVASDDSPASLATPIGPTARVVDAERALALLAAHPRIDPARIAVMGFSSGGRTVLLAAQSRFASVYRAAGLGFAAYIALYPTCALSLDGETAVEPGPIRIFHGLADSVTSAAQCEGYVLRLRAAGRDAAFTGYPGALHGYDNRPSASRVDLPGVPNNVRCRLQERPGGRVVNADTGEALKETDACQGRGIAYGPDPKAAAATRQAVTQLLNEVFGLTPR